MSITRRVALLAALGSVGGVLAGCAGQPAPTASGPAGTPSATPTPSPSATPTPSVDGRPRWPLTGQLLDDPALARHAAVAVKVPDNRNEHPQAGINDADIVFVQLEGYGDALGQSSTRLMPVYHSRLPADVAPVRSLRPVDVPLLAPVGAIIGSTGASEWVEAYVRSVGPALDASHTYLATRGKGADSIDRARVRVYQGQTYYDRAVVCHPKVLATLASGAVAGGPRQPLLPYALSDAEVSTASAKGAKLVRVPWKSGSTYDMVYLYDAPSGQYLRSVPWGPHVQVGGQRVTTDNVLVIRAAQRVDKIFPGEGGADPIHGIIDATGSFVYAHGGAYVTGRWAKGAVEAAFTFTLDDGRPLRLAAGRTFVELPDADADVRYT